MKIYQKFNYRGSEFNQVLFSELEDVIEYDTDNTFLQENINNMFSLMADEHEHVYISNGFIRGLYTEFDEIENSEWHHYFKKDEQDNFEAYELPFKYGQLGNN